MPRLDCVVQCVPNFSEGRKAETVAALVAAMRSVKGVLVLHQHVDPDHHRAVLGVVGRPEPVADAVFQAVRVAAGLIDLRRHEGVHPRVGATDVVPFIPSRGLSMEECVRLARLVGQRIGQELQIPVFLYERASTDPTRKNLEAIRRGGLQGLARRMETKPTWGPDFGPGVPHETAGVTVVGARHPLVAFNVNLRTNDVAVAKAIARKVRFSTGGLPGVKAIGVELRSRGLVQVSLNLTDYEATPLQVAFEAVEREAKEQGLEIDSGEIVGLILRPALQGVSQHFLQLTRFEPTQVVETGLEELTVNPGGLEV